MEEVMTRSKLREQVFLMLFMCEFHEAEELNEQEQLYAQELENISEENKEQITDRVKLVRTRLGEIDAMLSEKVEGWSFGRIGKVELAILRLAVFEIVFDDIPRGVAINEAVELAKKYGGEDSSSFVNGVLSKITAGDQ
jgi:N utilization substance protein B